MPVNHTLRISLLALVPLAVGACSGEIGQPAPPASTGSGDPTLSGTGLPGDPTSMTGSPGTADPIPGATSGGTGAPDATGGEDKPPALGSDAPPSMDVPEEVTDAITTGVALPLTLDGDPIYSRAVRLTHDQWERSVRDLLQLDGPTGEREGLTEDVLGVHDFSNNELNLEISPKLWADYELAAEGLAAQAAASETALGKIYSGTDASGFISTFGQRAFRRPLTPTEEATYQAIYDTGAALSKGGATEFARGAGLVIEAMLQSPHFLYRVELSAGDRLTSFELAAKLSLLLRGTTPSDELLAQAAEGAFDTDDGVRTLATTMLDEADAQQVMRLYHAELLQFNRFESIEKAAVDEYDNAMNADLLDASYRFFDRLYTESFGVKEMLTSTTAYATPAMAEFYGQTMLGTGMQEITLPAERPGFFTQLPFLITNSVNLVPDSIHRGVAINREVLCAEVPPPMVANVMLPPRKEDQSNRDVVNAGTGEGTCGTGCHSVYINPLGFAFENFDGLGRERDMDANKPVDTAASYPFTDGTKEFAGAPELMQILAEQPQTHACYAKHLAGFVLQRDLVEADQGLVDSVTESSQGTSGSIKQLLLSLVTSTAFTSRSGDAQ